MEKVILEKPDLKRSVNVPLSVTSVVDPDEVGSDYDFIDDIELLSNDGGYNKLVIQFIKDKVRHHKELASLNILANDARHEYTNWNGVTNFVAVFDTNLDIEEAEEHFKKPGSIKELVGEIEEIS